MKFKPTELPVNIATDFTHDSTEQEAKNQIELSALYFISLMNSVSSLAEQVKEFVNDEQATEHLFDIQHLSGIGKGLTDTILRSLSNLEIVEQIDDSEENGGGDIEELGNAQLGSLFADLLNNPNLPNEMYNAILNGLDATAAVTGEKRLSEIIESADYIAGIFDDWANK